MTAPIQQSKRVFIVHGWDGWPENHWFPWLKKRTRDAGIAELPVALESLLRIAQ